MNENTKKLEEEKLVLEQMQKKASDEEKELAKPVVNEIYKFLRGEGFETPVICDSSNGFHLCYKQNMLATPENAETMKKFLQVLDMYFSTEKVKIDVST